jgi:hypothetical protein
VVLPRARRSLVRKNRRPGAVCRGRLGRGSPRRGDPGRGGTAAGKAKLAEGIAGIARLHELLAEHLDETAAAQQVVVGIQTDRGSWVQALLAAGDRVWAINPLQVARSRERHSVLGAKRDAADAHTLADMVRTDRHQLRPTAGDSDPAEAIKVVARAHKTLIRERTRHTLRLRVALRSSSPPPWRPSPSCRPLRRWRCWAGRPIPSRRPG